MSDKKPDMAPASYTETYKGHWPQGPWRNEPDRAEWIYRGVQCLIVRAFSGSLCGYVGIDESHHCYKRHHESFDFTGDNKLTFSGFSDPHHHAYGRLHVDNVNDDLWWFGFHHYDTYCPALDWNTPGITKKEYRTIEYVTARVENLVDFFLDRVKS